jgi:DNA-binding transcriptional ArsR family regulator
MRGAGEVMVPRIFVFWEGLGGELGWDFAGSWAVAEIFLDTYILKEEYLDMMSTLRALAEQNRFQIVELLRGGPRAVGEMVDQLGLRQPQVSKHLRVLNDAGMVVVRVNAQRRVYSLRPEPLRELDAWLEGYRKLWEGNFQRLDTLLDKLKGQ